MFINFYPGPLQDAMCRHLNELLEHLQPIQTGDGDLYPKRPLEKMTFTSESMTSTARISVWSLFFAHHYTDVETHLWAVQILSLKFVQDMNFITFWNTELLEIPVTFTMISQSISPQVTIFEDRSSARHVYFWDLRFRHWVFLYEHHDSSPPSRRLLL